MRETLRLPIFRERFVKLRGDLSMSQAQFAEYLGISRPTVGLYESGERIPDAKTLQNIALKCGVSADYLLGIDPRSSSEAVLRGVLAYHRRLKQTEKMNAGNEESVSDIFEEALIEAIEAIRERQAATEEA